MQKQIKVPAVIGTIIPDAMGVAGVDSPETIAELSQEIGKMDMIERFSGYESLLKDAVRLWARQENQATPHIQRQN